jgi:hypothetical protein
MVNTAGPKVVSLLLHKSVGRLDQIIADLERLQNDAQGIFDAYVDELRCKTPWIPFGVLKAKALCLPAGSQLNYVAALKLLRDRVTGKEKSFA